MVTANKIGVIGAGAFGTGLAVSLGLSGKQVALWSRRAAQVKAMQEYGRNPDYLTDIELPKTVMPTHDMAVVAEADAILLCVPMQKLRHFLGEYFALLNGRILIATCKGIDLTTLKGPGSLVRDICPDSVCGVLTGPGFAQDIGRGLPTALTLAVDQEQKAVALQDLLTTPNMRLYRSTDLKGAELGGALKNVIAIGAGIVMGVGLGESARAALITRGYAEMVRFASFQGGRRDTMAGLCGLGDLMLTCQSLQSRNFRYGYALGSESDFDHSVTVEGVPTACAIYQLVKKLGIEMPITSMIARLIMGECSLKEGIAELLSRPLKEE